MQALPGRLPASGGSRGSGTVVARLGTIESLSNLPVHSPASARYGPSLGNYGALPQTWSNSNTTDNITGYPGDSDPLDALDISSIRAPIGGAYRVKVSAHLSHTRCSMPQSQSSSRCSRSATPPPTHPLAYFNSTCSHSTTAHAVLPLRDCRCEC